MGQAIGDGTRQGDQVCTVTRLVFLSAPIAGTQLVARLAGAETKLPGDSPQSTDSKDMAEEEKPGHSLD